MEWFSITFVFIRKPFTYRSYKVFFYQDVSWKSTKFIGIYNMSIYYSNTPFPEFQPTLHYEMNEQPNPNLPEIPTPCFGKKQHPIQNTMPSCEMTHPNPNPKGTLGHPGGSPNRNPGSGLSYEQGDSLGLWPSNPKKQVGLHKNPGICWVETTWKAKCPIFKAIVAGFRGKVA